MPTVKPRPIGARVLGAALALAAAGGLACETLTASRIYDAGDQAKATGNIPALETELDTLVQQGKALSDPSESFSVIFSAADVFERFKLWSRAAQTYDTAANIPGLSPMRQYMANFDQMRLGRFHRELAPLGLKAAERQLALLRTAPDPSATPAERLFLDASRTPLALATLQLHRADLAINVGKPEDAIAAAQDAIVRLGQDANGAQFLGPAKLVLHEALRHAGRAQDARAVVQEVRRNYPNIRPAIELELAEVRSDFRADALELWKDPAFRAQAANVARAHAGSPEGARLSADLGMASSLFAQEPKQVVSNLGSSLDVAWAGAKDDFERVWLLPHHVALAISLAELGNDAAARDAVSRLEKRAMQLPASVNANGAAQFALDQARALRTVLP